MANEKVSTTDTNIAVLDEDSMDEPDKEQVSGDERFGEKITEDDEDDDEERTAKEESEDETDSEDSESEGSDSLDEEEAEVRRSRYVNDMSNLEQQFGDLKEQLYKERITQIEEQLEEVNSNTIKVREGGYGEAKEFTGPLKQLEDNCIIRTEVAGHLKHYEEVNLENKLQCELQAVEQHYQNEDCHLIALLTSEFEEKLRKIEEERHTSEMYSDLWCDDSYRSRKKRKGVEMYVPDKRKKAITVTGPYIIYMLNEMDILEDWAAIRKAKSELARRKTSELSLQEKDPLVTARYEDGKFFYQGEWFQKGEKVILDNRIDSPVNASITGINTHEVWVSKKDGIKCKLYIAQFQKGKYTMHRPTIEDNILV